jgi:succinyl-CoA synthetase beta subunit
VLNLTEDLSKAFMRAQGLPVPQGTACDTASAAHAAAARMSGGAVVKALVAAGRRGKSGAVALVDDADAAQQAAQRMLGTEVAGLPVDRVYVEAREAIAHELYLSFVLDSYPPRMLLSCRGGVDIEQTHAQTPEAIVVMEVDPVHGVMPWDALAGWERAGAQARWLPGLGRLTAALWQAFVAADAQMLEINPLVVRADGTLVLVGAMLAVDDAALARHPAWRAFARSAAQRGGRIANDRERAVIDANERSPGAVFRYTELDGNIGLVVGGGGASLLQHDLMLAMGGAPANHLDATPGAGWQDKMGAVLDAILANPCVKGLLVSYNFLQLVRVDQRMQLIVDLLRARGIDPQRLPIVVRLFGPGEDEARRIAATLPGLHYMPPDSPIDAAVQRIVELTR